MCNNLLKCLQVLVLNCYFLCFRLPFLLQTNEYYGLAIVFVILVILTVIFHVITSYMDPGFVPRNMHENPAIQQTEPDSVLTSPKPSAVAREKSHHTVEIPPTSDASSSSPYPFVQITDQLPPQSVSPVPPNRIIYDSVFTRVVVVNGKTITVKYCQTCSTWRPPRTSHCSSCDRCVEGHDHHCPWTGNCIGTRNYRFFYFFIVSTSCLAFVTGACNLIFILNKSSGAVTSEHPIQFAVLVFCCLTFWSVGTLSVYHSWLITHNLTTHEQIRQGYSCNTAIGQHHPFHMGSCAKNCFWVLCRKLDKRTTDLESMRNNLSSTTLVPLFRRRQTVTDIGDSPSPANSPSPV